MTQPSLLPLPPSVADALRAPNTNSSLFFDRGFDQWTPVWGRVEAEPKKELIEGRQFFLGTFGDGFKLQEPPDYESRLDRRRKILETLGARIVLARTAAPLVIGLGLSHPTETGLLLDRLTGCPYLPATSVKGLLRAAARWAGQSELDVPGEGSAAFWAAHRDRLFGPAIVPGATAAKGELIVYDAFPENWPRLALDVLTPHYQPYYSNGEPPADWHDPTPVPFLTVASGTPFLFAFSARSAKSRGEDLDRVERLLHGALSCFGMGGKTSAGYGLFQESSKNPRTSGSAGTGPVVWPAAELTWEPGGGGVLTAVSRDGTKAQRRGEEAKALLEQLPEDARQRLTGKVPGAEKRKKRKALTCDVEVVQQSEEWFELVGVEEPSA